MCKSCYDRSRRENPEINDKVKTRNKSRYASKKEFYKARRQIPEIKEKLLTYNKEYYLKNKEILLQKVKENYPKHRDKRLAYAKKYFELVKNTEEFKTRKAKNNKNYKINNKDKVKTMRKKYYEKIKETPFFKISRQIKQAVRRAFEFVGTKKDNPTYKILGYTKEDLKSRRDFFLNKPCCDGRACGGKTIITIHGSHCDHIKPIKLCKTREDVIALNQLDNLQWICAPCNLSKNDKWDGEI